MVYEPDNSFGTADYLGGYSDTVSDYYSAQYLSFGDDDFAYVYAYAGDTISINTYSSNSYFDSVDTTVSLYQGYNGSLVAFDDDGGAGLDSSLSYNVQSSGYYYFDVAGYTNSNTGYYDLSVTVA